jgi:hypothetical protein
MTTLILGGNGPLGIAFARQVLAAGQSVIAAVQTPHRIPPAFHDLRDEHPSLLTAILWSASSAPTLPPIARVIVTELPIPPAQTDEASDATADIRALTIDAILADVRSALTPTLSAIQLVAQLRPERVLIQASWLGSIEDKIRGGGYNIGVAYAAQLMLVRAAALDLSRAGIATVVGNAGRYKLDMAGPEFHAEVDDVAKGLLTVLERAQAGAEPEFRDWRGGLRRW